MENIDKILKLTKEYQEANIRMNERYAIWENDKSTFIKDTLAKISSAISAQNDFFKNNVYVDSDDNNIAIKSGEIALPFDENNLSENGFHIGFSRISNGKVYVYFHQHTLLGLGEDEKLFLFDNLEDITEAKIIKLVYEGIEKGMHSSFLFAGDK
ncbi:hypothetical protein [Brumimicrobium oceani]|uniref:Uncharacterized protein n=1 Tax=Brumimicrobium oceani TaxID=2100725 RepID=A0A2U2XGV2_9FLAO|nr:hypothetical protein [Brumimicrobium oceani]PWH87026.1 hypothetical protein DIT68_01845 [Brumimicrobium oceani]